MNQIRFCEFVDNICVKIEEGGKAEDVRKMAADLIKEVYEKKKSDMKEKNKEEVIETIKKSFGDIPPSSSFFPKDGDFATFQSCVKVLREIEREEQHSQRTQVRLTIWRGRTIERIRKLRKIKIAKIKIFLKEEINIELSRASIFLAVKLYKLSQTYPKLMTCTLSVHFIQKHFIHLQDYLEEDHRRSRGEVFDSLMNSPPHTGITQEMDVTDLSSN